MNESEFIDCSPDTSIIASYRRNPNLNTWKAIAEIVDNSFDAGANRVAIDWNQKQRCLTITDDGRGCKDPQSMAKLGGSFRQATSGVVLGRYGIGLKEASVWMCNRMVVTSAFEGGGWRITVDWQQMEETKQWRFQVSRDGIYKGHGVCVEMESIRPTVRPVCAEHIQTLAEIFRPAILSGRQIVVQGEPVAAPDLPLLKEQVEKDGEFEGRAYNVKYGIKADKSNAYGWTIAYGHRILTANYTKAGFGEHSPSRFYGYITLYDTGLNRWALNRFKDGFDGIDALLESLEPEIAPMLQQAEAEGLDLEIQSAIGQVENDLNRVFGKKIQEKRPGTAGKEGAVEPKNTGRRRVEAKHADPSHPGSVAVKAGKFTKFKVLLDWDREGQIGHCTPQGKLLFIHLNPNHPRFVSAESKQQALRECAVSLLCGYAAFQSGNEQLLMEFAADLESGDRFDVFRSALSNVLSSVFSGHDNTGLAA